MITFTLQLLDGFRRGRLHYFELYFLYVWLIWASKVVFSRRYRPYTGSTTVSGTAVIPVVDESPEVFAQVLELIVASGIEQIVVVMNGQRNRSLEAVCEQLSPDVEWAWTPEPGKRGAVALGVALARHDIVVLVDSDTIWTPGTWDELRRPFAEPRVGGVSTHQKIIQPERHWITRFADWLEDIRTETSMPAMSVLGHVGCLPGRTIAFRREILELAMPEFLTERFLGIHLEVSDDRALTNYALRYGYRTVYQRTSVVYTDAPTTFKKFLRQQLRWSKGSQYNTLKMLPWMCRRAPMLAVWYTADILIPFLFVSVVLVAGYNVVTQHNSVPGLEEHRWLMWGGAVIGCVAGFVLRQFRHLRKNSRDLGFLPAFIALLIVVMTPIRLWGFLRAGMDQGWGTRQDGYAGRKHCSPLAYIPTLIGVSLLVSFWLLGIVIEQPARGRALARGTGGLFFLAAVVVPVGLFVGRTVTSRDRRAMVAALPLSVVGRPEIVRALSNAGHRGDSDVASDGLVARSSVRGRVVARYGEETADPGRVSPSESTDGRPGS